MYAARLRLHVTLHHCVNFRIHFKDFIVIQAVKIGRKAYRQFKLEEKAMGVAKRMAKTLENTGIKEQDKASG